MRTCARCGCGVSDKKLEMAQVLGWDGRYKPGLHPVCKDNAKCMKQKKFRADATAHAAKLERLKREMDFNS